MDDKSEIVSRAYYVLFSSAIPDGFSCTVLAAPAAVSMVSHAVDRLSHSVIASCTLSNTQRLVFLNSMVFSYKGYKSVKLGKNGVGGECSFTKLHVFVC